MVGRFWPFVMGGDLCFGRSVFLVLESLSRKKGRSDDSID